MKPLLIVALTVPLLLVGACNSADVTGGQPVGSGSGYTDAEPPAQQTQDPYAVYLAANPDPSLILTREDAQTRALLGCTATYAPGTVDYVLQQAYADICAANAQP